jgi:hypothetical protein
MGKNVVLCLFTTKMLEGAEYKHTCTYIQFTGKIGGFLEIYWGGFRGGPKGPRPPLLKGNNILTNCICIRS